MSSPNPELRFVITRTADPAPWLTWNRYPSGIIGAAFKLGHRRMLSVVWRKPNVNKGDWS